MLPFLPTGRAPYRALVASFEVTLKDRTIEVVEHADAYQQEGPMTTFFATASDRQVVDCWSTRLASFRTSEILIVRRLTGAPSRHVGAHPGQRGQGDEPTGCDRQDRSLQSLVARQ